MTEVMEKFKGYQRLSAGTLKLIAIITMLIDHFAAGVYLQLYLSGFLRQQGMADNAISIYNTCRNIGRFAFPIFCFLLVEGFYYTRSRWKYLRNLVIFAFASEVPFDILLMGDIGFKGQNVYFTLAIAMATIWGIDTVKEKLQEKAFGKWFFQFVILIAGCLSAYMLNTDYSYYGIVLVLIFYLYRDNRFIACVIGYLWFTFEPWCFPAFIALLFYNGKRGIGLKYFFYTFYPAHLLLLYGLRVILIGN